MFLGVVGAVVALSVIGNLFGDGDEISASAPTESPAAAKGEAAVTDVTDEASDDAAKEKAEKEKAEKEKAAKEKAAKEDSQKKVGDRVAVGDFEFVVNDFKCGIESVGNEYLGAEAKGQYCIMDLMITNAGDSEITFFDDSVKVLDKSGREFSTSSDSIYLEDVDWLLTQINPGVEVAGQLLFDVPADTQPTEAQLGGGLFDAPVVVRL